MCDASSLFLASLALTGAQSISSYVSSSQQAKAQADYQQKQAEAYAEASRLNQEAAVKEQIELSAAERMQQMQTQESIATEKQALQREYLQKQGQALASSNAAGGVLNVLLSDFANQYGVQQDILSRQYEMVGISADTNIRAYKDQAENRIKSQGTYVPTPVNGANLWTSALGLGAGLAGGLGYGYGKGYFSSSSSLSPITSTFYDGTLKTNKNLFS